MKLQNEHYLRINSDGTSHEVVTTFTERKVTEKMMEEFSGSTPRYLKRVAELESTGGTAQMVILGRELFMVARLDKVVLNCKFRMNGAEELVPVFLGKEKSPESEGLIEASPEWSVPADMMLLFAARISNWSDLGQKPASMPDQSCYLIAYDSDKRAWKLPLPNLHGDCAICMGKFKGSDGSISGAFDLALEQFRKSDWNADLNEGHGKSDKLFRFKADKKITSSIPPDVKWVDLCAKVSTPVTNLIGGLL